MPIKSYLVYPEHGFCDRVYDQIAILPGCELRKSLNHELLILVTDTPDPLSEVHLKEQLQAVPHIRHLALVAGFETAEAL